MAVVIDMLAVVVASQGVAALVIACSVGRGPVPPAAFSVLVAVAVTVSQLRNSRFAMSVAIPV
jgi:hypothetical protein